MNDSAATTLTIIGSILAILIASYHAFFVSRIKLDSSSIPIENTDTNTTLEKESKTESDLESSGSSDIYKELQRISSYIAEGADAFLYSEYRYLSVFIVVFSIFLGIVVGVGNKDAIRGVLTAVAFIVGSLTSIASGFIGMRIAVLANSRTALNACYGYDKAFKTAFRAAMVMGFGLVGLGVVVLFILLSIYSKLGIFSNYSRDPQTAMKLFETIAGYGLGGSSIALFGRVGGGIYTKAADVGADLSGKVCNDFPEDDPRNPAVIADNVGDNVGDIAGMGADLFGSLAEGSCAVMVLSSRILFNSWSALIFPLVIISLGVMVSWIVSFAATNIQSISTSRKIEPALKLQLLLSTIVMTPLVFAATTICLPKLMFINITMTSIHSWRIGLCVLCGLWTGLGIGYMTEYFTSYSYKPVRECSKACEAGAAPNIIYGLALGYKSTIVPTTCLCATIVLSHYLANMYGVGCAALGILSTLSTSLTIDAYGPICDNAGGLAEMCHMPSTTRERTDDLDAAGNTTAAIGKGFAIGSAALVSLALFSAYMTSANLAVADILSAWVFSGVLYGSMLPYWFSALTMKSVGKAAFDMVKEVERQLDVNTESGRAIRQNKQAPDYSACIAISTRASLREMIAPGALVVLTPIITGFVFGKLALAGLLAGNIVSGVQMAISASNTGGAWDNAKKYLSSTGRKGTDEYRAAVIGDTVGDPLKDTSGPSINILVKLSAIISVVFATSLPDKGWVQGLLDKIN